jgi:hypothetical protein
MKGVSRHVSFQTHKVVFLEATSHFIVEFVRCIFHSSSALLDFRAEIFPSCSENNFEMLKFPNGLSPSPNSAPVAPSRGILKSSDAIAAKSIKRWNGNHSEAAKTRITYTKNY